MEVEGQDAGDDDVAARMLPVEDSHKDEVVRPRRHVRNVVNSDDEPINGDGDAEVGPVQPPGTIAVFDELAPEDAANPCEFSLPWLLVAVWLMTFLHWDCGLSCEFVFGHTTNVCFVFCSFRTLP